MPRHHPSLGWYQILSSWEVTSTVSIIKSCFKKKNLGLLQCPSGKCSSHKLVQRPKSHMVKYGHTSDPTLGTSFFLFLLIIAIFFFASLWPKCLPKKFFWQENIYFGSWFQRVSVLHGKTYGKVHVNRSMGRGTLLWGTRKQKVITIRFQVEL